MNACVNDADVIRLLEKNNLAYIRTVTETTSTVETEGASNVFVAIFDANNCYVRSMVLPKKLRDKWLGQST